MNLYRLIPAIAAVGAITACSGDATSTIVTPDPAAAIRWVNAVSDTMPQDFRVVDVATNASQDNLAYKGISGNWRRVPVGTHELKAFQTGEITVGGLPAGDVSIVSKVLGDVTSNFVDKHLYTIVDAGFLKAGNTSPQKFFIFDDVLPTPAATAVAFRFFNADPNRSVDIYATSGTAVATTVTGTPAASGVAYGAMTPWISLPVTASPNSYVITVTAAGSTTVLTSVVAPAGIPSRAQTTTTAALDAVAGSQLGASALTAVYFPANPAGGYTITNPAVAPPVVNTATVAAPTAGISFVVDVNPPRISP